MPQDLKKFNRDSKLIAALPPDQKEAIISHIDQIIGPDLVEALSRAFAEENAQRICDLLHPRLAVHIARTNILTILSLLYLHGIIVFKEPNEPTAQPNVS